MKRLTITARLTLLCTLVTAVIAALALGVLVTGEQGMLAKYYRETLIAAGELARDEITWKKGRVEIDRDLDEMPNVFVEVRSKDGDLLYGHAEFEEPFIEGVRKLRAGGREWYVYDTEVSSGSGQTVRLRLYMAPDTADSLGGIVLKLMLIIFPALVVLAGVGGYAAARRALRPVDRIITIASGIADGADLKKRIGSTGAEDELNRMAEVFDDMLERLDSAFERERRFTADVSHELRTPVAAILTQSDMALLPEATDADRKSALEEINARARGMRTLTQKLLTLSRMDAGQLLPETEKTDMAVIVEMAADMLTEAAEEKNITVSAVLPETAVVMGDQTMLTQAVMNIAENAVKYGKTGGNVFIKLEDMQDAVRLTVTDDGIGMTDAQRERIFDRFYQADPSRRGEGAGLGLALTRRIVQLHSGRIDAEGIPGGGSRFTVTIPKGGVTG